MSVTIHDGDALTVLRTLPDASVQCCVTSPPYFGLRDYGMAGQIGLEATPDAYVQRMVDLFREVRRVLRDDGTLWLNIGDSYAAARGGTTPPAETLGGGVNGWMPDGARVNRDRHDGYNPTRDAARIGMKHKDLIGIPWLLAFALRADGWYLRSDIIWHKPNPMPESVTDRPTKAHEYVFLLSKSARYYYDADAIAEPVAHPQLVGKPQRVNYADESKLGRAEVDPHVVLRGAERNARTVWSITTQPFSGAHFATMPPELARRCIMAGSRIGDTVLDPFGGAGTTGLVADRLGRNATLIELNPAYAAMARERITNDAPLFTEVA